MQISYTIINHLARKELGLTMNEYAVADLIYNLSNHPEADYPSWCYATKTTMGQMLDLSKRSVLSIIDKLVEKGLVEKHGMTKHLKTTKAWYNSVIIKYGEESSPLVKKNGEEIAPAVKNLHRQGEESSPPSNKDNNKENKKNNKKEKIEKNVDEAIVELLAYWNELYDTRYKAVVPLRGNVRYWLETYTLQDIKLAIKNFKHNAFWKEKMRPMIFFRQENQRNEKVDYIGEFINLAIDQEDEARAVEPPPEHYEYLKKMSLIDQGNRREVTSDGG